MLYLILAILTSAAFSITMRFIEGRTSGSIVKPAANYLMCMALAALHGGLSGLSPSLGGLPAAVGMGAFNGLLYLVCFVILQLNITRNGVVLSSTFMKLGLLVPMALSVLLFGEIPSPMQAIGFFLALAAILLINSEQEKTVMNFKLGLILMLLAGGASDSMSKVFEELGNPEFSGLFFFCTFASAMVLSIMLAVLRKEKPTRDTLIFGLILGIPNYYSSRFILDALYHLPAVIVYPSYSVGTIVVVSLAGVVFFKEKLSQRQLGAMAIILAALMLLNM